MNGVFTYINRATAVAERWRDDSLPAHNIPGKVPLEYILPFCEAQRSTAAIPSPAADPAPKVKVAGAGRIGSNSENLPLWQSEITFSRTRVDALYYCG